MPCSEAMVDRKIISATPETTLEEAIELFDEHSIRSVPVIDSDGKLVGLFNFHHLLTTILPLPVSLGDDLKRLKGMDISLGHLVGQSEWLAGRLKNFLDCPLKDIMVTDPKFVHPETPLREGVRLLAQYCSPLPVTDEKTGQLVGLISSQSAIRVLLKMKADLKRGRPVEDFDE